MRHGIKIIVEIFLVIFLFLTCAVLFWLGPITKYALQAAGPAFLGVPVEVEYLKIDPIAGKIHMRDLQVGNWRGFRNPEVFQIKKLQVEVDMSSLVKDTIVIKNILIESPHVTYELDNGKANLGEVIAHVTALAKDKKSPKKRFEKAKQKEKVRKVVINKLTVFDCSMLVSSKSRPELDVKLSLGAISARMPDGTLSFSEFTVGVPDGFLMNYIFRIPAIAVEFDPDSIYTRDITIHDILFDTPQIVLERSRDQVVVEMLMQLASEIPEPVKKIEEVDAIVKAGLEKPVETPKTEVTVELVKVTDFTLGLLDSSVAAQDAAIWPSITIAEASIIPEEGEADVRDIFITNPKGFAIPNLLELKSFGVGYETVVKETNTMNVVKVQIDQPLVAYERHMLSDNFKIFQEQFQSFITSGNSKEEVEGAPPKKKAKGHLVIEKLLMNDGKVKAKLAAALPVTPIPLPALELDDIGSESGGVTFTEATSLVFSILYQSIVSTATGVTGAATDVVKGAGSLTIDTIQDPVGSVKDLGGATMNTATDVTKGTVGIATNTTKAVSDSVSGVTKGVLNLLGKDDSSESTDNQ